MGLEGAPEQGRLVLRQSSLTSPKELLKRSPFYPRPTVVSGPVSAVGQAGGVLLTETIRVADAPAALAAIDTARAAARAQVWKRAGVHAPDHDASAVAPLIVDLDATLVTAHSDKEAAAPTHQRGFGFHPRLRV